MKTLRTHPWESESRKAIADVCHRLYEQRYLVATSGNVSLRSRDGLIITPRATRKDAVDAASIVACRSDGTPRKRGQEPSSEIVMHREIYRRRPDVGAIVHAHPQYCIACSLADISLTDMLLPELAIYVGPVPSVPYATPGTPEMYDVLDPFVEGHNAFLLERHGALVLGSDLQDAFNRLEHLEHMAQIVYLISSMGGIEPLTKLELRKLTVQARRIGEQISKTVHELLE